MNIIKVKDHSVSGEFFELHFDNNYQMYSTSPQPKASELPGYYKSENYISHTDAKRNWFEKLYQGVKSIALKQKINWIEDYASTGKQLLDVGCGTGDFLKTAQDSGWTVSGVEPNADARTIANQKTNQSVFDTDQILKWAPERFDVITMWHVLEHVPNVTLQLEQLKALLKPNGVLIIAVPNFKSYDAAYYKSFWAAYDVPRHLWHFSKQAISKFCSDLQMQMLSIKPMKFDAYYVSLLSEKYKNGKMNPINAFWIGWTSNRKAKQSGEYSSLVYVLKKD